VQFEERGTFSMNHFDGQSIYTWNIDGKSEHEIFNTLQEMILAMTAYKIRGLDSRTQAIAVINGLQGQLKYWWDNFLSKEEQAAAKSVLINLRCLTLSHYRWYEDGLQQFWKERFIAGLPRLFGEGISVRFNFSYQGVCISFRYL